MVCEYYELGKSKPFETKICDIWEAEGIWKTFTTQPEHMHQ